jgi:hypothetical protein
MPVSNALKRLLRIRDLEQEQHRRTLESALSELRQLEEALDRAAARERSGRSGFTAGVLNREPSKLQPALVETSIGQRHAHALEPRIARATVQAALRRQEFLLKRMERRQAETLIRETEAADAIEATRQSQQALDDWFLARSLGDRRDPAVAQTPAEESSNLPSSLSALE